MPFSLENLPAGSQHVIYILFAYSTASGSTVDDIDTLWQLMHLLSMDVNIILANKCLFPFLHI